MMSQVRVQVRRCHFCGVSISLRTAGRRCTCPEPTAEQIAGISRDQAQEVWRLWSLQCCAPTIAAQLGLQFEVVAQVLAGRLCPDVRASVMRSQATVEIIPFAR